MIYEPSKRNCPECSHPRLMRATHWLTSPNDVLQLGETWHCTECDYRWTNPLNNAEEDIL